MAKVAAALRALSAASRTFASACFLLRQHGVDAFVRVFRRKAGARLDQLRQIIAVAGSERAAIGRARRQDASRLRARVGVDADWRIADRARGTGRRPHSRAPGTGRWTCAGIRRAMRRASRHGGGGPGRAAGQRGRGRGEHQRADNGRDRPGQESVRGVAERDLVRVKPDPAGAQPAGQVAAGGGGNPLHDHQPDRCGDGEGLRRHARTRPWRHGGQAEAGAQRDQDERRRRGDERAAENRLPGHGRTPVSRGHKPECRPGTGPLAIVISASVSLNATTGR